MPERIVVVGGGVVGCAIAAQLADEGLAPTLLEARGIAAGVSGASLAAIVRHLAGPVDELPFVLDSTALWASLASRLRDEVGIDIEFDTCGQLRLVERDAPDGELVELETIVEAEREAGLDVTMLDRSHVEHQVPLLDASTIKGASWCPGDAKLNALLACRALAAAIVTRGGQLLVGERVVRLEYDGAWRVRTASTVFEADAVVVAAGPWTPALLAPLNERLSTALWPKRAQCCATACLPPLIAPVISSVSVGISLGYTQLHQTRHGEILFNTVVDAIDPGLAEEELQPAVELDFLVASARTLSRLFPSLGVVRVLRSWAACEAWTRDHRFLLGPLPELPGLLIAAGDSGTGFLRAPLIGRLIAEMLLGRAPSHDLRPYAPTRRELEEAA
ncbi:MAG: FAD-binding oxidoreductase [Actinobacteria bacterium]|nr:MAG: FAD-binding oxidoreductase [Actinomycetota bacterium]